MTGDRDENDESKESVELKTPLGRIRAYGMLTQFTLLLIVFFMAVWFLIMQHEQSTQDRDRQTQTALRGVHDSVVDLTYVMTLSQDRREKLQLDMPDSLRARAHRSRRDDE